MKKIINLSFIVLGSSSVIGQVIIIRELMINFYGNEFFIGWILFGWLFWVGLGSFALSKLFIKSKNISKIFIYCHLLVAIFLFLEIYLIRLTRFVTGGISGEIPNLIPSLFYTLVIIAPLCLILGLQFAIGTKFWSLIIPQTEISQLIGKSYLYETLGYIIGGLVFSYFLILINEFKVFSILALLNFITAICIFILAKNQSFVLKLIFVILIICISAVFILSENINIQTTQLRFPNQKLIKSYNSFYGNIAITKTEKQYNFYENGLLLGTDKEEIFNEYLVHFPLLYHHNPQNILLIGTGFNGALAEILKYQPQKIYYLEFDPQLLFVIKKYLPYNFSQILEDKRIKIFTIDSRYFLKTNQEIFDVIIVNLPNPSTALINRFYTREFFQQIQSHLKPDGIFSIHLSFSPNYLSKELENLNASLYKTIQSVFPFLIILPEDTNFFIASSQNILNYDPEVLIQKLKKRNIKTYFVNEPYIKYRLTNNRVQLVLNVLKANKEAKINYDQQPIIYYYNLIYWLSYFHLKLAKFLIIFSKIKLSWIITGLFILSIILGITLREKNSFQNLLPLAVAIAGFSLMAIEIIIIYAFQVFYGYLYYKISLIITVLMIGLAIGSWLGIKKISGPRIKSLIILHSLIIIFCLFFLFCSWILFLIPPKPSFIMEVFFLTLAALIGGIVGFEFPIVNQLYLSKIETADQKTGIIYGADLFGSCLGTFLISIFILPIFGIFQTLLFLITINILIIILFLFSH